MPLALIVARAVHLDGNSLASPSQIISAGWEALGDGTLAATTGQTLACAFTGLAIGFLLGLFHLFDLLMEITAELVRPLPSVAPIQIMLLVFGFGYRMEIRHRRFATT